MRHDQVLPPDEEHLSHLSKVQAWVMAEQDQLIDLAQPELRLLSVSLSAIYEAATCHRRCHGGPHVLESILGRAYNLALGAWVLVRSAQYDEALNLIRGLGEINNLLLLFMHEPGAISIWLTSTRRERLKAFGPAQVRKKLAKHITWQPAGDDWYAELCEQFVHVQPGTRPGQHSHGITGQIGPVVQEQGRDRAIGELQQTVFPIALSACKWFEFDDTFIKLGKLLEQVGGGATPSHAG